LPTNTLTLKCKKLLLSHFNSLSIANLAIVNSHIASFYFAARRLKFIHRSGNNQSSSSPLDRCSNNIRQPSLINLKEIQMKTNILSVVTLSVATLFAGQAIATSSMTTPKTTQQVQAELAQAVRSGDMLAGNTGLQLNEVRPDLYMKPTASVSKSSAQVRSELAVAVQAGNMIVGESGARQNEINAAKYPAKPVAPASNVPASEVTRTIDISPGA
jgi:ribosomal protein L30E